MRVEGVGARVRRVSWRSLVDCASERGGRFGVAGFGWLASAR